MVQVAARIGYRAIGLRLIAVTDDSPGYPIMDDAVMMRETRAALADTGLRVSERKSVPIWQLCRISLSRRSSRTS